MKEKLLLERERGVVQLERRKEVKSQRFCTVHVGSGRALYMVGIDQVRSWL